MYFQAESRPVQRKNPNTSSFDVPSTKSSAASLNTAKVISQEPSLSFSIFSREIVLVTPTTKRRMPGHSRWQQLNFVRRPDGSSTANVKVYSKSRTRCRHFRFVQSHDRALTTTSLPSRPTRSSNAAAPRPRKGEFVDNRIGFGVENYRQPDEPAVYRPGRG